jgi:hypothetical protein
MAIRITTHDGSGDRQLVVAIAPLSEPESSAKGSKFGCHAGVSIHGSGI